MNASTLELFKWQLSETEAKLKLALEANADSTAAVHPDTSAALVVFSHAHPS